MTLNMPSTPVDVRLMDALSRLLMLVLVCLSVFVVGQWAYRHPAWPVRSLVLVGDVVHQSAPAVRAQLNGRIAGSFLSVDVERIQALVEDMPWVRKAVVQRAFPSHLRITIEEHQARAWWGEAGAQRLVNNYGELFEASADDAASDATQWPVLDGAPEQARDIYQAYLSLNQAVAPLAKAVQSLRVSEQGGWHAVLSGNVHLDLGRGTPADITQRVQPFVSTVSELTQRYQGDLEAADLRYPNGYALRLRGVTTGKQ